MVIQAASAKTKDQLMSVFARRQNSAALVGLRISPPAIRLCEKDFDVTPSNPRRFFFPGTGPSACLSSRRTKQDRRPNVRGLHGLAEEDPTFRCFLTKKPTKRPSQLNQLPAWAKLHLEMQSSAKPVVSVNSRWRANAGASPQILRNRETIQKKPSPARAERPEGQIFIYSN